MTWVLLVIVIMLGVGSCGKEELKSASDYENTKEETIHKAAVKCRKWTFTDTLGGGVYGWKEKERTLITTFGLTHNEYSGAFTNVIVLDDLFKEE